MEDWPDERLLSETPATPAAFAVFYSRHEGAVLGYFMRRTGQAELAADLAAETFAAALLGARRFRPDQAEAVRARVLDQLSYKEIAAAVKTSEAVVRKRVSRGLMTLRGLL